MFLSRLDPNSFENHITRFMDGKPWEIVGTVDSLVDYIASDVLSLDFESGMGAEEELADMGDMDDLSEDELGVLLDEKLDGIV